MSLASGMRIGQYEIQSLLGIGGMGEVHRATDTRLKRQVAIKILPSSFSADPERLARFQREAELLASLNHPHIAAIYGLEDAGPTLALVMELVEGPTLDVLLADRKAALPLDETLHIARQIADALEAAHARGIVHRDLKPSNIKVRPDGTIKVLDFGLAKALDAGDSSSPGSRSPTLPTLTSPAMTQLGVVLGTAAYMSPEQARGKPVDKRTDIWSFGVVLFEMLTGARLFVADEVSDTMAFVLTREPDWSTIPVDTPAQIRTLLRRCLQKDRTKRLADIADARLEIDDALSAPPPPAANVVVVAPSGPWRRAVPWAVAGAAVVALLATLALWSPWRSASGATYARVTADLGAQVVVNVGIGGSLALSPDGSTMAFAARLPTDPLLARGQLYVRRLADLHATPVAGTAGAAAPFFSPDGQWIGFFAGGSLKKVNVGGGAVVTLCEAPTPRGGSWIDGDEIVFASLAAGGVGGGVLMRVAATGGHPTPITTAAPEDYGHIWPQALPGDAGILYTAPTSFADYNQARIVVQRDSGDPIVIHTGGYFARYLPSGHLTFVRDGTLFVAPFSLQSAALTGQPVPIIDNLGIAPLGGGALFTASGTGTIAYMSNAAANLISRAPVMWLDRAGGLQSLREDPSGWGTPRLSPDGRRLAFTMSDGGQQDIWIYDWERGTLTRLTSDPANDMVPVWTPDGTRIAFASQRGRAAAQGANLYWQRADGTGEAERLTDSPISQLPDGWHPNGRVLVFHEGDPRTGRQRLMMLPMNGDATSGLKPGAPTELLGGPYLKAFARFSPDGRWLAYVTIEAKVPQVYVQPFPGPGSRLLISSDGGSVPMWSRTRPELYYSTSGGQDQQMMVVRYTVDAGVFTAERPQPLGKARFSANTPLIAYGPGIDLHPDGERFVVAPANPAVDNAESRVVFIFNAFEEVRRLTRATSAQR